MPVHGIGRFPQVARLIANIGFTDMVEKYVQSCRKEIGAKEAKILDDYVKHMRTLSSLCDTRSEEQREKYGDLIEPLANERVVALLQRAVDAGILDRHYQPVPQTSPATESHRLCGVEPMQTAQPVCPV